MCGRGIELHKLGGGGSCIRVWERKRELHKNEWERKRELHKSVGEEERVA